MHLLSHDQAKEHLFRKKHAFAAMAIIIRCDVRTVFVKKYLI